MTIVISFGLPIGLAIYFRIKEKISIKAVGVGILVFIFAQMILRMPLISRLSANGGFASILESNKLMYVAFLAVTAGFFEEVCKYLGFKFFLRNKLERKNAIALGIGHSGIEAIFLVGGAMITNLMFALIINMGSFDTGVVGQMPEAQALALKDALINTPSYMFLLGGLERAFVIAFQIALTIIVLEAIVKNDKRYLIYAILIHTLVDYIAGFNNIWVTEGIMLIVAIFSIRFIYRSKKKFNQLEELQVEPIK
jgi:uncharacterized membrane protein YhfC